MEKQSGYEGSVVRMKMQHSGKYLRATTDAERVVQSWADDWEWYQVWRLLDKDASLPDSGKTAVPNLGNYASVYGTSVHYSDNRLFVEIGSAFEGSADVRILDLQGREVMRKHANHSAVFGVQNLASGIYHVVVQNKNRTDIRRFKK